MAGISGQGTTFTLPNYVGELFLVTPTDTPLLSAIGGLTGGKRSTSKDFEWQYEDLRAPGQNVALEGANAPTAQARVRATTSNVCEIHQEAVETSYTKQAAIGNRDGLTIDGSNPVINEHDHQVMLALAEIARDVEYAFLQGVYQKPSDNVTPRMTRGLIAAIEAAATNVIDTSATVTLATSADSDDIVDTAAAHGFLENTQIQFTALTGGSNVSTDTTYYVIATSLAAQTFKFSLTLGGAAVDFGSNITAGTVVALVDNTEAQVLDLLQTTWDNGGIRESETATLIANSWGKRKLTDIFVTQKNYREMSRNVGGVDLTTIETDFGRLNIMLNRYMRPTDIACASLDQLAPVLLEIPGKGFLFQEELAKVGAAERTQIYGEIGLEYGAPNAHGIIQHLSTQTQPTA